MSIGDYVNTKNNVIGAAVLYYGANNEPLFDDNAALFDPTIPCGYKLTITGATSITLTVATQTTGTLTVAGLTTAQIIAAVGALTNVGGTQNVRAVQSVTAGIWYVYVVPGTAASGLPFTVTPTGGTATITAPRWSTPGSTVQGWTWAYAPTTTPYNIEEQPTAVGIGITDASFTISGEMAEDTDDNLALSVGGLISVTAATTTSPARTDVAIQATVLTYAAVLEYQNEYGLARRIYVPSNAATSGSSVALRRAAAMHSMGLTLTAICATPAIDFRNITAPHS